ncbi:MAG: hypothetical protein IJV92_01350 [Phascolarctobacterium sp.]|nr:hypothetical protein [Phascolarctobacterium sp.]
MKRILGICICLLLLASNAFAADATIENKKVTYSFKANYPLVNLEDQQAATEINRFIAKKIQAYRKVSNNHNYLEGIVDYEVKYEDKDYLSIVFTYWWYYQNAAHGMYNTSGIVFDKNSGKLVNLKHFVPELNVKNLIKKVNSGELVIRNSRNEEIQLSEPWKIDRVSHSYYIDEDKTVYLIYQPYELASYADGNTYIKITQDEAHKLKD